MKTILFFVSLIFITHNIKAQPKPELASGNAPGRGIITGTVHDGIDNNAMEYVNVILYNRTDSSMITGTITNAAGEFKLKEIPYGNYYVLVQFMGYNKIRKEIEVSEKNKIINLEKIVIKPATVGINEVSVEAERNYVQYKIDKKIVDVSKNPNAAGGTATDALRDVPGVNVDAEGNVSIRGNTNITVLIDGRQTAMSAADVLRQTPAGAIENIEVITNPSAKYDPDGSSGIINIIMKKQTANGTNGIINASAGTKDKYSTDFLMNYRTEKWNFFAVAGYNYRKNMQGSKIDRSDYMGASFDTTKRILSKFDRGYIPHGYNFKAGADYFLDEKTTLSLTQEAGNFGFDREGKFYHQLWYEPGPASIYYIVDDQFELNGNYLNSNFNLQKKFEDKGHEFNANIFYSWFDSYRLNEQENQSTDAMWNISDLSPYKYKTNNLITRNTARVKADYTKPISENSKIEAGFQCDISDARMNYHKYNFDPSFSSWNEDMQWLGTYSIFQQVYAAYGTYTNVFKGIEYQTGLRGEYMKRNLETNATEKNSLIELVKLYPSLHASYQLPAKQTIQASYSRRIQRPEEWMLNPYPNFSDGQFSSVGNAKLKPSNMDAVELNYMKALTTGNISLTGFYRHNTDIISQIFSWENGVFMTKWENVGINNTYGLESMANLKLLKWLRINVGGSLFQDDLFVTTSDSTKISTKNLNYNFRISPALELKTGTVLQIIAAYNGPNSFGQGKSEPFFSLDAAIRQNFMKDKLTVSLRATNLTASKQKFQISDSRYYIKQEVYPEAYSVMLSVSYKINNYTRNNRPNTGIQFEGGL